MNQIYLENINVSSLIRLTPITTVSVKKIWIKIVFISFNCKLICERQCDKRKIQIIIEVAIIKSQLMK